MKSKKCFFVFSATAILVTFMTTQMLVVSAASDERMQERTKAREEAGIQAGTKVEVQEAKTIAANIQVNILTEAEKADIIGKICQQDAQKSGILASVSAAQCILESGYLGTSLAQEANNCFGMKANLSGNLWTGSTWNGEIYAKQTWEEYGGQVVYITADFRKYDSVEESLADHSAYLLGAKNGDQMRYAGLKGEKDYRKAIQIIKDGGYATDSKYVDKICSIIEKYNLTRYDHAEGDAGGIYRVRKAWSDEDSQIGAFIDLENAKEKCNKGYKVFDGVGNVVYEK